MSGWIKLHRKMLEWEWYDDLPTFRLFTHLLLTVNFEKKRWRGIEVNPGQIVTGRKSLSEETGLTEMQIRTALNKLKSTNEITIKTTKHYSVITIVSWFDYQDNDQQINQQATNKQPTSNQQVTTTKERKNIRKKEKVVSKLSLTERQQFFYEELKEYTSKHHKNTLRAFYDYWSEPNQTKTKMRCEMEKTWDTSRRLSNWERREKAMPVKNNFNQPQPRKLKEYKDPDEEIKKYINNFEPKFQAIK